MQRVNDLLILIRAHQHQIVRKEYRVTLATHVAVTSRGFVLNNLAEKQKFDDYIGDDFEIQYDRGNDRLSVKHTFLNNTYIIDFKPNQHPRWSKQFELGQIFDQNINLVDARSIIDRIRKTLQDISRYARNHPIPPPNQVSVQSFQPLHVDVDDVDETLAFEPPPKLDTPNIFNKKKK